MPKKISIESRNIISLCSYEVLVAPIHFSFTHYAVTKQYRFMRITELHNFLKSKRKHKQFGEQNNSTESTKVLREREGEECTQRSL